MFQIFDLWWHGQLTTLFGMPVLWIGRIGKVFQLLSGLVILLDIIGKERLELLGNDFAKLLNSLAKAEPLRRIIRDAWMATMLFWGWQFSLMKGQEDRKKAIDLIVSHPGISLMIFVMGLGIIPALTIYYSIYQFEWGWKLLWQIPLTWFIIGWIILLGFFILLNLISIILFVIFYPLEKLTDLIFRSLTKIIVNRGIVRPIIYISFILFILGTVMDFLSS